MATVYVNPTTGNDSTGDGTASLPWLTVDKANNETALNDVIVIQAGTHNMTNTTMGYFNEVRTYQGEQTLGINTTILDCQGNQINVSFGATSAAMTFQSLTIKNINTTDLSSTTGIAGSLCAFLLNNDDITVNINNCEFIGAAIGGVGLGNNAFARGPLFSSQSSTTGIDYNFTQCLFSDLGLISGGSGASIVGTQQTGQLDVSFTSCTFDVNPPTFSGASQMQAFVACRQSGNVTEDSTITIRNSIAYSTSGSVEITRQRPPSTGSWTLDMDYPDNILFGTYTVDSDTVGGISNCLTSDPLFVSAVNGNYNPRPDSPAKNIGVIV